MKHLLIKSDGSFDVMTLCCADATVDGELQKWPSSERARIVEVREFPTLNLDNAFRGAWRCVDGSAGYCMTTARDIHRDRMRGARQERLARLDVAHMRAIGAQDTALADRIEAAKQELRDVTRHPGLDAASDVDALKSVWPSCLSQTDIETQKPEPGVNHESLALEVRTAKLEAFVRSIGEAVET